MRHQARVGIIADQPLQQHLLQNVIVEEGYEVGVNTHPEKVNAALLRSDTISVWVVNLVDSDAWDDVLEQILDHSCAPVFFGDGKAPERNSTEFPSWRRRIITKLKEFADPIAEVKSAPVLDLDALISANRVDPSDVIKLPARFRYANPSQVDHVCVVAASLGGPSPVKEFFDRIPADLPAAFLYAQHIDEGCIDALVASVGRHTELKMELVSEGCQLENGKILVVPVSREIQFQANHVVEILENGWSGPYGPSIDHLFKNVAARYKNMTSAIVFSGMGSDGTLGATSIVDAGGTVWAQDCQSAIEPSMPDSVSEAGYVSFRGSPEQLARKFVEQLLADTTSLEVTAT
ncbi:chemotaxis protein CheB [Gynuella sp.]|uniref:chemotaxis protein CheB n=1 Tax=Gynuella sp. TaxID=2969146 RepID=UPI003D1188C5